MKIQIRKARKSDCATILFFIRSLAEFEKLSHEMRATEQQLRATLFGPSSTAEVLLAFYGKKPAGFALFFPTYSTFLAKPGIYLEDLFVRPELRNKSIGSRLLAEVAAVAAKRGSGRLEWSVLDWNKNAIRLYRRLGAKPMSDWTVHRMQKKEFTQLARLRKK